jgi:hypothetical protein
MLCGGQQQRARNIGKHIAQLRMLRVNFIITAFSVLQRNA